MLPITRGQIMDLIGSINFMENRLGGRKPNQGKGKGVQKNTSKDAVGENNSQADTNHALTEYDARIGGNVDTTA